MFGNLEPKFVESRRAALEVYLTTLVEHSGLSSLARNAGVPVDPEATLLQTSQDLRAFVPAGFLKDPPEEILRFEVIEVNTFGLNRSMQLTLQPRLDGVLLFRDAGGSGGLDSSANQIVIPIHDILSVTDVDGSHVRATLAYSSEDVRHGHGHTHGHGHGHHHHTTHAQQPTRNGGSQYTPSKTTSVTSSSMHTSSSFSSTSMNSSASASKLQLTHTGDWVDSEGLEPSPLHMTGYQAVTNSPVTPVTPTAAAPTPSTSFSATSSSLASTSGSHHMRTKKKTLEFCAFEDRLRFVRMVKYLVALRDHSHSGASVDSASASASNTNTNASSATASPVSPNSLALYPPPSTQAQAWTSIFSTTWNQAKEPEPEDLSHWIPKNGGNYDILAIGTQECPTSLGDLTDAIQKHLGSSYYVVGRKALWEIKLIVFAHTTLGLGSVIHCVETDSVATGIMGIMGNKGGTAVAFRILDTSVCFINTHLAPHMERYADRNRMFDEIDASLKVGSSELDASLKFDHLFWLGDLNYRIEIPHQHVVDLATTRQFDLLFPKDQLRRAQWAQEAFTCYSEGVLAFPPTYKYIMPKKKSKGSSGTSNASGSKDPSRHNSVVSPPPPPSANTGTGSGTGSGSGLNSNSSDASDSRSDTESPPPPPPPPQPLPSVTEEDEANETSVATRLGAATLDDNGASGTDGSWNFTRPHQQSIAQTRFASYSIGSEDDGLTMLEGDSSGEEEEEEEDDHDDDDDDDDADDSAHSDPNLDSDAVDESEDDSVGHLPSSHTFAHPRSSVSPLSTSVPSEPSLIDAMVDMLDPDFVSYSRTRVRADHSGMSGPPLPVFTSVTSTTSTSGSTVTTATTATTHAASQTFARPVPTNATNTNHTPTAAAAAPSTAPALPPKLLPSNAHTADPSSNSLTKDKTGKSSSSTVPSQSSSPSPATNNIALPRKSIKGFSSSPNDSNGRRRSATVPGIPRRKVFSRTYGKKRIPSWCDRILYRSHRIEGAKLKGYYRCDLVATSDHIPVIAIFDLRLPLLPPLTAYSYPAAILFSNLTIDLTVHPLKLGRHDLSFLEKIYVEFYGTVLAETSRGKRTGYATIKVRRGKRRTYLLFAYCTQANTVVVCTDRSTSPSSCVLFVLFA